MGILANWTFGSLVREDKLVGSVGYKRRGLDCGHTSY